MLWTVSQRCENRPKTQFAEVTEKLLPQRAISIGYKEQSTIHPINAEVNYFTSAYFRKANELKNLQSNLLPQKQLILLKFCGSNRLQVKRIITSAACMAAAGRLVGVSRGSSPVAEVPRWGSVHPLELRSPGVHPQRQGNGWKAGGR